MGLDSNLRSELQRGNTDPGRSEVKPDSRVKSVPPAAPVNAAVQVPEVREPEWYERKFEKAEALLGELRARCKSVTGTQEQPAADAAVDAVLSALENALHPEPAPSFVFEGSALPHASDELLSVEDIFVEVPGYEATPPSIDPSLSWLQGGKLRITLRSIPSYARRLYYILSPPGAEASGEILNVTREQYQRDGMLYADVMQQEITVTLFWEFVFPNGESLTSENVKMVFSDKPKKRVSYRIEWTKEGWRRSRTVAGRLTLSSDAHILPEMKLIYRRDGFIPIDANEDGAEVLYTFKGYCAQNESNALLLEFPDTKWKELPKGTALRLVVSDDSAKEYELNCEDIASMQIQ